MTSEDQVRASDHDREHAAEVLCDAYAVGRLDLEELQDRASAAYSAKTWAELRDLTADLPTEQVLSRAVFGADSRAGVAPLRHAPQRPLARIWVMAVIWLVIAAAAHTAAAVSLVLLALLVLRAAHWTVLPEQITPVPVHPSGEHAVQAQRLCATEAFGRVPDDQVRRAERGPRAAQPGACRELCRCGSSGDATGGVR